MSRRQKASGGSRNRRRVKIAPVTSENPEVKHEIDSEIAIYNRTGNMLALWAVVGICARKDVKLPPGINEIFADIAERIVSHARRNILGARELVADDVLGTKNETGGRSVFQEYALIKRDAAIVERVRALLMEDAEALQNHAKARPETSRTSRAKPRSRTGVKSPPSLPAIRSQTEVYNQVAEEYDVRPATVKRLFEKDDRQAGSFSYRALNRYAGGIVEL